MLIVNAVLLRLAFAVPDYQADSHVVEFQHESLRLRPSLDHLTVIPTMI
jgi:hypothetical protein